MSNRVHFTLANRAWGLTGFEPLAKAYFYENETSTPVSIYSDSALATPVSPPMIADAYGNFAEVFIAGADPIRILVTNASNVPLPGYPVDNVLPLGVDTAGAASIPFSPTAALPQSDVQAAIEAAAAIAADQTEVYQRSSTAWTTGGTGNDYSILPTPTVTSYGSWQSFDILADRANTAGNATLNVNNLGTRPLLKRSRTSALGALSSGDIQPGLTYRVVFDGTQFVIHDRLPTYTTSVSNGVLVRETSSVQTCRVEKTATFLNANILSADWTFPAAFDASPHILATFPSATADYTGCAIGDFAPITTNSLTTTSVTVFFNRATGASNFIAGDSVVNIRLLAYGRWF